MLCLFFYLNRHMTKFVRVSISLISTETMHTEIKVI